VGKYKLILLLNFMHTKKLTILWLLILTIGVNSCSPKVTEPIVLVKTSFGNIKLKLHNETPAHRDNFLKLVDNGYFDSTLFHRVIKNFMIQGGDPDSKNAEAGRSLGEGGPGYTLPAEIIYPKYFHKKGALAAARLGDNINPEKRSSGSQFYIVQGEKFSNEKLSKIENQNRERNKRKIFNEVLVDYKDSINLIVAKNNNKKTMQFQQKIMDLVDKKYNEITKFSIPENIKEVYKTLGGTPHLDDNYTVFGEVVDDKTIIETVKSWFGKKYGLEVVNAIASEKTDAKNRPLKDIIIETKVIRRK